MRTKIFLLAVACACGAGCQRDSDGSASKPSATQTPSKPAPTKMPERTPPLIPAPEDVAAAPADAQRTASGLAYKVLQRGTGEAHPTAEDSVEVHYTGWTPDGRMFDSSLRRGAPARFSLKGVIPGWTEGLQLMAEGEKARFWIPANLAYGEKPMGGKPAGMLVFDVELRKILKLPTTPPDVAAVPKDAKKTKSGLAYRVLKPGTGTRHPQSTEVVQVNYAGWTTDGKLFDTSYRRGVPATFRLDGVIRGWTEGVQLMVEGEKTRFWIPADLAYGDKPGGGKPAGTLVFEIELLRIQQ